jgi:hypothetical protein
LLRIFKELKSSDVWNTSRSVEFVSKEPLCQRGETEEECEASDKDDW